MKPYDHSKIEKKWQKFWDENKVYKTLDAKRATTKGIKPYYVLDMFPYPSGSGLHVGHPRGYIASDVFARMKRMQGFNVLHPMGFDSFGLPAEQYAIQTGKNPATFTEQLVKRYKTQLSILGLSYDWDRQVATHDPKYYKWTQWIFLQIYNSWYDTKKKTARPIEELEKIFETKGNKSITAWTSYSSIFTAKEWNEKSEIEKQDILMNYRLAYEGYAEVNWCAELGTVLANDEIVEKNGKMVSERGDFPVEKKSMRQWFMRITAYGDRLLEGLETIDWSHSIKEIQKNWIGKSEGAEIEFTLSHDKSVTVFTTRPDTLFGVTYVVLAPEHQLVQELKSSIKNWKEVEQYIVDTKRKDDMARTANEKNKTGVRLDGIFATNPANGESVPVWIADYVLANYGTGAVMAVPAHDERDFTFAKKYDLPIRQVIEPVFEDTAGDTAVRPELEIHYRDVVVVAVRDPKNNKYLTISWKGIDMKGFITGGIDGDDIESAARREILEETGYKNLKLNFISPINIHTKFYQRQKQINRHARWNFVVFDLINEEKEEISTEEKKLHDIVWIDESKLLNYFSTPESIYLAHILNERFEFLTNEGLLANSEQFNGLYSSDAKKKITEHVNGKWVTKYKFRDAIFARQRYWGEPIPLVHTKIKPKVIVKFDYQKTWDALINGVKTIETRALNPHEKNNYFGDVEVGDIILFFNKKTKEERYVQIKKKYIWKSFEQLFKDPLLESICSDKKWYKNLKSVDELRESYSYNSEYISLIEKYGLIGWSFEFVDPSIIHLVPEKQLPLELPKVKSYAPAGDGQSPLATVKSWVTAGYETNTMPGWAGSSWYFLRYTDPKNKKKFADNSELDYWFGKNGGVNMYVGGAEHSTGHLLYSRFWHKVLHDLGHVKSEEPFMKLRNQGMIGGADGRKMSKRWGNVVNPDDVVKQFGADTLRVYETFVGPFESDLPWNTDGIVGSRRFIERIWRFQEKVSDAKTPIELQKSLHKTIKKVTDDIATFSFNTAISAMMIFANELEKHEFINVKDFKKFIQILAPFAPYMTDELWNIFGEKKSIHCAPWPVYDPKLIVDDTFTIGIQINGKVRAEITISKDINQGELEEKVYAMDDVVKWIDGKPVKKFIYVPGRIINIVI